MCVCMKISFHSFAAHKQTFSSSNEKRKRFFFLFVLCFLCFIRCERSEYRAIAHHSHFVVFASRHRSFIRCRQFISNSYKKISGRRPIHSRVHQLFYVHRSNETIKHPIHIDSECRKRKENLLRAEHLFSMRNKRKIDWNVFLLFKMSIAWRNCFKFSLLQVKVSMFISDSGDYGSSVLELCVYPKVVTPKKEKKRQRSSSTRK